MKISPFLLFIISLLLTSQVYAIEDLTIYAQPNGSYTYRDINYSLVDFPIEQALSDKSSGKEGPNVDSVVPVTVEIFPVENVGFDELKLIVRPLAVQFHRRGAKINTRFLNNIIPYIFKKPSFFKVK